MWRKEDGGKGGEGEKVFGERGGGGGGDERQRQKVRETETD